MKHPPLVALLGVTTLTLAAPAQVLIAEAGKRHLPADRFDTKALALADMDGDGDRDLVVGVGDGRLRLLRNDGTARFVDATASSVPSVPVAFFAIAAGDLDGDGDQDILLACGNSPVGVLLNNGAGVLVDASATHVGPGTNGSTWTCWRSVRRASCSATTARACSPTSGPRCCRSCPPVPSTRRWTTSTAMGSWTSRSLSAM